MRFADDVVLLATSKKYLVAMLEDLAKATDRVGLELHMGKTKIMANSWAHHASSSSYVHAMGKKVEVLPLGASQAYLGRLLCLDTLHETEISNRLERAWKKFFAWKGELCNRAYSLQHRLRLFDSVITPTVLYASSTWTMTAEREKQVKSTQKRMLRWMVGARRTVVPTGDVYDSDSSDDSTCDEPDDQENQEDDKMETETWVAWIIRATGIAESQAGRAGVTDWVQGQRTRQWNFAGHTARRSDNRWSTRLLNWLPESCTRGVGHPKARWSDCLDRYLDFTYGSSGDWIEITQDRDTWNYIAEDFVVADAWR